MSRGTDFLTFVVQKIKVRVAELDEEILHVQEDISQMNDYYWQNYTEMDEYGYEDYDNQQALMAQMGANEQNRLTLHRLQKMEDEPFFGSVEFLYDGDTTPELFYIGIGNFATERGAVPLIYDWRAPVSSLFYDYDKGAAAYESPGGLMKGEILSKWQYKIKKGRMVFELESDIKVDDEILLQELGTSSDTSLKTIVRTIQREQNAIIRNTRDRILVIQGAAGSGKTSVALHRIAYLLYHDRQDLNSSNILVLSPNSVFSDYISRILPELGEENIREMSLDLFAYRELKGIVDDTQDRWDLIEEEMAGRKPEVLRRYHFKQSKEGVQALEGFLIELEDRLMDFHTVTFGNYEMSAEEIMDYFYNRCGSRPLLERMEQVQYFFVDEYETLSDRELEGDELLEIREQFYGMYESEDLYEIYNWFLEECGFPLLPDVPPEERVLDYEDVYPMLYLKCRLCGGMVHKDILHLVIDEMQDYSYLQYDILHRIFPCNMTILGDEAQTVEGEPQDVRAFLSDIFGRKIRQIEMKKSYRNTTQIADYARQIYGDLGEDIEYVDRPGKPVEILSAGSYEELADKILLQVQDGERVGDDEDKEPFETAAVLTLTEREARELYEIFCDSAQLMGEEDLPEISYIDRNSSVFKPGITITTFYMAKGLEFDQVFLVDNDQKNPLYKQYQYIGATRALHELYVAGDK